MNLTKRNNAQANRSLQHEVAVTLGKRPEVKLLLAISGVLHKSFNSGVLTCEEASGDCVA
jgi:hypothetical protein